MTLVRTAFNSSATFSGAFYLAYNPVDLNLNMSNAHKMLQILDGGAIKQSPFFDSRPFILRWENIPINLSVNGSFSKMLATLQDYVDSKKYVNFSDIDYSVPTIGWVNVRITDLKINIKKGSTPLVQTVVLTLTPEA